MEHQNILHVLFLRGFITFFFSLVGIWRRGSTKWLPRSSGRIVYDLFLRRSAKGEGIKTKKTL
jgi:hypothetical protein